MRFGALLGLVVLAAMTASSATTATDPTQEDLAIVGVAVLDGSGTPATPNRTVLIHRGRILAITPASKRPPAGYRRFDGRGKTVLPGLWDLHVHSLWSPNTPGSFFPRFVAYGVTTVRDMGGNEDGQAAARAFSADHPAWSPRVYRAGRLLDGPEPVDPNISIAVSTADEARAAVDRLADGGADFIKVYTLLPREAFLAAGDEARRRGLRIAGHLPADATVDDAIAINMASIEHMVAEIGGYCPKTDEAACEPIFTRLIAAGIAQEPTLLPRWRRAGEADHPEWGEDPDLASLPGAVRDYWLEDLRSKLAAPAELSARRRSDFTHETWMARRLIARGGVILAGSDAGTPFSWPGRSLHEELALLVEAGVTPAQAISMATWRAARFMGADGHSGRIAAGYDADLIIVDGDPAHRIADLRRIVAVVRGGVLLDRETLDRMLARRSNG